MENAVTIEFGQYIADNYNQLVGLITTTVRGDRYMAEDLLHSLWLRSESLDNTFKGDCSQTSYILSCVRNDFKNELRSKARREKRYKSIKHEVSYLHEFEELITEDYIQKAMLTPEEIILLEMFIKDGMSTTQVWTIMTELRGYSHHGAWDALKQMKEKVREAISQ